MVVNRKMGASQEAPASSPQQQEQEEENKKNVTEENIDKRVKQFLRNLNKKWEDEDEDDDGIVPASQAVVKAMPIPTSYPDFNKATGINGMPNNGVVEIFGPEGIGKTWIALDTMAQAQKLIKNRRVAMADLEGASDPDRLRFAGINMDELYIITPCMGEYLFEKIEAMVKSELFSVITIDSVPALQPKSIYEGDIGDRNFGPIAALLADALRKVAPACRRHNTLLILINQVRQNIGASQFEPQDITTGGRAIKFYSHMRIQLKKFFKSNNNSGNKVKFDITDAAGNMIGHRVIAKFVKNRYGPPFKEGVFEVMYQEPDLAIEVIKQAKKAGLWKIHKGNYSYVGLDDKLVVAPSEEDFMRRLVIQGKLVEIAERLMGIDANSDSDTRYLGEEFDMVRLAKTQENERKKYAFIATSLSIENNEEQKSEPEPDSEPDSGRQ